MPIFELNTNIPASFFAEKENSFLTITSKLISDLLGKPESYVLVRVNAGQLMCFGGTTEPCAVVNLFSLGAVGGEKNKTLVSNISNHLHKCLNVPPDRMYIHIQDVPRNDMGWNSKTFA